MDPEKVPAMTYVHQLEEIRGDEFLTFRRSLVTDRVLIIKVITSSLVPLLQEALFLCNLSGDSAVVDLTEVSAMSADRRREDVYLLDIKAILMDENSLKVVDKIEDLINFGKRVHAPMKEEDYQELKHWHPDLPDEYCATTRYEFPGRFKKLVAPFRVSENTWNWNWNLKESPRGLGAEQGRLLYALKSSLIGLTLDGVILRTFAEPIEKFPRDQLAFRLKEVLTEELLEYLEDNKSTTMDTTEAAELPAETGKTVRFPEINGVEVATSLAFGMIQRRNCRTNIEEKFSNVLVPLRVFINDVAGWEEIIPFLVIIPSEARFEDGPVEEEQIERRPAGKCLKPFQPSEIRYNVITYDPDPDTTDRHRFRFPRLDTSLRIGTSRTASPPPRPDDPNGIWSEYEHRRRGDRFYGPPLPKSGAPRSKSFIRSREWEFNLPDEAGAGSSKDRARSNSRGAARNPGASDRADTERITGRQTRDPAGNRKRAGKRKYRRRR